MSYAPPPPGSSWRVVDVPPAHHPLATGRAVTVAAAQGPRLQAALGEQLTGDPWLVSVAFVPLLHEGKPQGLLMLVAAMPLRR
jgi:GAF domain-containing protein